MHHVERDSSRMILYFFREGVSQPGESAYVHPHGEISALDITRADLVWIGVASDRLTFAADARGRTMAPLGLPTERERTGAIVGQANDLVRQIVAVIDGLVTTSVDQRTSSDFIRVRADVFPQYTAAIMALGALTRIVLPKHTIERLSVEAFSEMEADLRDKGVSTFGSDLTERGLFTVWTLRKIYDLAKEIEIVEMPKDHIEEDANKARDFVRFGCGIDSTLIASSSHSEPRSRFIPR